jgi:16S rRNA (guanine966-N2)-methyltransferase
MTRIISGAARGRTLRVPDSGTRPTSDRVREALFSSLEALLSFDGARVLDLFAGTGALGLEAASRGAGYVALVESARPAALVLRHNVDTLALPGVVVRPQSVESYLSPANNDAAQAFDVVLADPPYDYAQPALGVVLQRLVAIPGCLADDAVLVLERSIRSGEPPWPDAVLPIKSKRYGDSVLWYGQRQ